MNIIDTKFEQFTLDAFNNSLIGDDRRYARGIFYSAVVAVLDELTSEQECGSILTKLSEMCDNLETFAQEAAKYTRHVTH